METTKRTETKKAKLIFRFGKYKNERIGIEKDAFLSKFGGKIAYADIKMNLRPGVSYNCEMIFSPKGRAYEVIATEKTPVTKASLIFKKGKRKINESTNDFIENMVSTFEEKIVIAPPSLNVEPKIEYAVEMVLSPEGKAYIVERAEPTLPSKAEIVAHESPLSIVEVVIDGNQVDELRFDCMAGDENILQEKISNLRSRSVVDKEMIVSNYEATCRDLMQKHLSKIN